MYLKIFWVEGSELLEIATKKNKKATPTFTMGRTNLKRTKPKENKPKIFHQSQT